MTRSKKAFVLGQAELPLLPLKNCSEIDRTCLKLFATKIIKRWFLVDLKRL